MELNLANGLLSGSVYLGGGIGSLLALLLIKYKSRKYLDTINQVMSSNYDYS